MNIKNKRKKRGFTLIELIVVIAILGILAAVAVPKLSGFTTSAKNGADKATLTTINNAISLYCVDNKVDNLTVDSTGVAGPKSTSSTDVIAFLVSKNYIPSTAKIQGSTVYTYVQADNAVE